jgi:D-alanine-D-alanine ligase
MIVPANPFKPPVLLLYNLNPDWPQEDIDSTRQMARIFRTAMEAEGHNVKEICLERQNLRQLLRQYSADEYIIFNWCEELPGIPHSYDLIARILEDEHFIFTGADSGVLAFSQDKRKVKMRLDSLQIPTPRWQVISPPESDVWNIFPAIVKPALEHCSFGITQESVVYSSHQLATRLEYVQETFHQPAVVEEFIDGREFHVSLVGDGRVQVLPIAEMDYSAFSDSRDRLCTFDSKFDPASEHYKLIKLVLPAQLSELEEARLVNTASAAYYASGCRDYARLDIRLMNGIFYVLDVNPNADISPDTSLVLSAEKAGLSYGQFGSLLVSFAAQRHPLFFQHYSMASLLEGSR